VTEQKRLRAVKGDHNYSLDDSFSSGPLHITQTAYFRAGNIVVAIGELNRRNRWDDDAFEAAMKHLQAAWNAALRARAQTQGDPKDHPTEGR
jgi:hypothetical protein